MRVKIRKEIHTRSAFAFERGVYWFKKIENSLKSGNVFTCKASLKYLQARRIYVHYVNEFQIKQALPLTDGPGKKVSEDEFFEKQIGTLNGNWGINGYKTAAPGHPVFDDSNRYVIYLEPEKTGEVKRVPFYKDTLKPFIQFNL